MRDKLFKNAALFATLLIFLQTLIGITAKLKMSTIREFAILDVLAVILISSMDRDSVKSLKIVGLFVISLGLMSGHIEIAFIGLSAIAIAFFCLKRRTKNASTRQRRNKW